MEEKKLIFGTNIEALKETKTKVSQLQQNGQSANRIYFPELDGLRFFAFLLVFVHHHPLFKEILYFSFLHDYGWMGVDLFFTLSAFLFTKLLIAEFHKTKTISFKKFYIRRIFRIWPVYFLYLIFSVALYVFLNGSINNNIGVRIIGLSTFTDNIMSSLYGYNPLPYTGHLWTISYEEQFYVFIPIIILLLVRSSLKRRIISLISIALLFNIFRLVMIEEEVHHPAIWVLPFTHFESILLGLVIGFGGFKFLLKMFSSLMIGVIGLFFFVLLCLLPNVDAISYWLILNYTFVGISTSMILFSVLNSDFLKKIFSKKIFVFLGKRSYGLYLYHLLGNGIASFLIAKTTILPSNTLVSFIYSLLFTVIVSIVSYWLIETPFLKMKKKFEVVISRPI